MRFRETNHLRKWANEAGKNMRGGHRRKPSFAKADPQCGKCHYLLSSHQSAGIKREQYLANGMCENFTESVNP
jgi:hypothetical protein